MVRLSIYDLPTLPAWHKGVVCLTGDAAHAVTPHAGQGASLSMESAMTLGKCLRDIPDTEQAFTKYHNLQKKRAKKVQQISRRNVWILSYKNSLQRWIRSVLFSVLSTTLRKKQEIEMYGYKIDWNKKVHSN